MSAENVSIVRSVYENFAAGDIPAVLAVLDPDIEWVEATQECLPHHRTHHGPEAVVAKVFGMVMQYCDEFAVVPEAFHDGTAEPWPTTTTTTPTPGDSPSRPVDGRKPAELD